MTLKTAKDIDIRFSEVDSMGVVWHGSYLVYFEDAREAFGAQWGLGYNDYIDNGYYAPMVELTFNYKHPLKYGDKARVEITYQPTLSAKVVFDYAIYNREDNTLAATGHSVQVFMNLNYDMVWYDPPFYKEWKERWGVTEQFQKP